MSISCIDLTRFCTALIGQTWCPKKMAGNFPACDGPGSFDQPVCSCLPMGHITYMRGAGSPVAFIICNPLKKAIGIRKVIKV